MNKPTPGPWKITNRGCIEGHFKPTNPDGGFHADVCRVELNHSDGSGPANLTLIAAAPELLEAAQEALEALFNLAPKYREPGCFNGRDCGYCTACKLRDAIKKAKGGS